jgi:hypothetical protein
MEHYIHAFGVQENVFVHEAAGSHVMQMFGRLREFH